MLVLAPDKSPPNLHSCHLPILLIIGIVYFLTLREKVIPLESRQSQSAIVSELFDLQNRPISQAPTITKEIQPILSSDVTFKISSTKK